jgi:opacity protein-like surface antigen
MRRKFLAIAVVLFVAGLWIQVAAALEPLGPPAAGLNEAQWGIGLDFSHSRTDLKLTDGKSKIDGAPSSAIGPWKISNFTTDVATVYIGCGLTNQLEGFVRIGGISTEDSSGKLTTYDVNGVPTANPTRHSGHTGYAFGFGGKATFWEQDELKLGGIVQFNWAKPNSRAKVDRGGEIGVGSYDADFVIMSVQIAAGPTYRLTDDVSVYGGPFLQYISGDIKLKGPYPPFPTVDEKHTAGIDEENCFGGYVGLQIELTKNNPLNIEYQHTATDNAIAMNVVWKY